MVDLVTIQLGASAHMGPGELGPMPAARVMRLATASMDRQADQLRVAMQLAVLPMEAFGKKTPISDALCGTINLWRGQPKIWVDEEEAAAIAELEREMAEEYPWYADPDRLQKVWSEYGSASPNRNDDPYRRMAIPPGVFF